MKDKIKLGRPKRQPTIVPPKWWPTLKAKFLYYSFRLQPSALIELAAQVRDNKMTPLQWAEKWGVRGTWIERWAEETLTSWRKEPPNIGYITYLCPSGNRAEEGFSFTITGAIPDCRMAFGVTVGGKPRKGEPKDDWRRFHRSLHRRLDYELEIYCANMLRTGMLQELDLGTDEDLELKLQAAALKVFGNKSQEEIGQYEGIARDRSVISRWLKKILPLLELE